MFVSVVVSDFQKHSAIELADQKYNLDKKYQTIRALEDFVQNVNKYIHNSMAYKENTLKYKLYETIGFIKAQKPNELSSYLDTIEKNSEFQFAVFDTKDFKVLYGEASINYLQQLIFGESRGRTKQINTLKYIFSQGERNLQYWRDDQKKTIRLSFFTKIPSQDLYIGIFSIVDSLRVITKNSIIEHIQMHSQDKNFRIWFYDYISDELFNFQGKGKTLHRYELDGKSINHPIITYYNDEGSIKGSYNDFVHNFNKFSFLVSIEYQKGDLYQKVISVKETIIKEAAATLSNQIFLIGFVAFILLIASFLFSKFITTIFTRYTLEQKRQKELLNEWKERYKLAIIASNDGFWDINLETWDIYFSKRWFEMYGYSQGDVNNFDEWLTLVHKDDYARVKYLFDKHLQGNSDHFICEYRLKTKANRYKWVLARGKVFWDQKRMLMMSMDMDKPKKMENELQEAERLVEDGRIVIFRWKKDLSVEYVSKSISNYGYKKDAIQNKNYLDIVYHEDKELLKNSIESAVKEDKTFFFSSYRIIDGEGSIKWIFSRAIIIKDDFSQVKHFYGYIHDITRIKLSEEELKQKVAIEVEKNIQKDRLLIQQSKLASMGEMLGSIAHQWRQPLNNVSLILHFIKDSFAQQSISEKKLQEYVKRAKDQIDYMSDTIDVFRNFFKPSKAKEQFLVSEAIQSALSIINVQLYSHDVEIELFLEDIAVFGYENEFKQAILNILNNAKDAIALKKEKRDFSPKISIKTEKKDQKCSITLSNNGGRVSNEVKQRMFDPYYTTKFENKGTGIGLYMCKTIIEGNMQGEIDVQNSKDGVIFEILLPLCYNTLHQNHQNKELP